MGQNEIDADRRAVANYVVVVSACIVEAIIAGDVLIEERKPRTDALLG